jgi:hypothetical protein
VQIRAAKEVPLGQLSLRLDLEENEGSKLVFLDQRKRIMGKRPETAATICYKQKK